MQDGTVLGHVLKDIIVDEEAYCHGHVAAEIIQAINWVQCRKITDDDGGCPETDIYILFNNGNELEKAILEAVEKEMDGIQIIPCYAPTVQKKKIRSKIGKEIVARLKKLPKGEYPAIKMLADIKAEMGSGWHKGAGDFQAIQRLFKWKIGRSLIVSL